MVRRGTDTVSARVIGMTGYTVHTGTSLKFSSGWDRIFKGAKSADESTGSKSEKSTKKEKSATKKAAKVAKASKAASKKTAKKKSAKRGK